MTDWDSAVRLAIAAVVGLGAGVEREWSGHSSGARARFAGMRTFMMLGMAGGVAGLLLSAGYTAAGASVLAGAMGLTVAAYVMTVRRPDAETEGTTEVAAVVVIALGALAGTGMLVLAAAAGAVTVLALHEKERLHGAVSQVRPEEIRAALRFSVLALVVLPLLPPGPVLGALEIRPRQLWVIVLLFSAINFAAYVARRAAGAHRGYGLVGMLGGLISSTAVTLDFSRRSRADPALARSLASGVIGACTVLIPRVLAVSAVLNSAVALRLLPYLGAALLVGAAFVVRDWRARAPVPDHMADAPPGNPLRLDLAIKMALLFQVAMTAVDYARSVWSAPGFYATSAVLGLTDVDALTVGMSRPSDPMPARLAARAIAVGILANTLFKTAMAQALGAAAFRRDVLLGLGALAVAIAAALALL